MYHMVYNQPPYTIGYILLSIRLNYLIILNILIMMQRKPVSTLPQYLDRYTKCLYTWSILSVDFELCPNIWSIILVSAIRFCFDQNYFVMKRILILRTLNL